MLKRLLTSISSIQVRRTGRLVLATLLIAMMPNGPAHAQGGLKIIRDAEIETIIRAFTTPLFVEAGLNPADVKIRLIQDSTLNAFVAGGQNIFIHTGLLLDSKDPNALIGVIAHETGHIEGGHLTRTRSAIEDASMVQMLGTVLGAVAAIGTGRSDVGQAVIMGSQSTGQRIFMQYSRTQESAADQAAMRLLDATKRSAKGLEGFLSQLGDQEVLSTRLQDPYAQTHPLSRERIDTLRAFITTSPYSETPPSSEDILAHAIIVAKLYAFINPFISTLRQYPESDQSYPARYARAIAYYRKPDIQNALSMVDALIKERPQDPYLLELKGQMLFEHARAREALEAYTKSFELAPNEPLILMELARVELEIGTDEMLDKSIEHYDIAHRQGAGNSFSWQQLGIAYGRKGNGAMSDLALAESELLSGQYSSAEFHAGRAVSQLKVGSPNHLHAQDILEAIKTAQARKKEREK